MIRRMLTPYEQPFENQKDIYKNIFLNSSIRFEYNSYNLPGYPSKP